MLETFRGKQGCYHYKAINTSLTKKVLVYVTLDGRSKVCAEEHNIEIETQEELERFANKNELNYN